MSDLGIDASPTRTPTQTIAGSVALSLLASPLNVHILQALSEGPKSLLDLRKSVGSPPQSTMRLYSRTLSEKGILERRRRPEFQSSVYYELTLGGQQLIEVAEVLESWLAGAPAGPIALGSTAWKSATKALVEGWSFNIVRALAARALSLTELNQVIPGTSYASLGRRLGEMRLANLVVPQPSGRRGTAYGATNWLRRSIVPMIAAAAWERRHRPPGARQIGRLGVEAAYLLAIPLLRMPPTFSGRFRLAVQVPADGAPLFAGVLAGFDGGALTACSSRLDGEADAWISGPAGAWLKRMGRLEDGLEMKGDATAAGELLNALSDLAALPPRLDGSPAQ